MKTVPDNKTPENGKKEDNASDGNLSSSQLNTRIKQLEKELRQKDSEIEFLKEKFANNQEVLLDVIEDKKLLKKQIEEFELKELDEKLNNYRELQRNHHKVEHRLFVTQKNLDAAREKLQVRDQVIEDLEKRGLRDYLLGQFPDSYVKYIKSQK